MSAALPESATGRPADGKLQAGLKEAMRLFPQGVTVVTTQSIKGPKGITVSSFTSVSLNPPLVLVSIARESNLHNTFVSATSFAVNLLADDQRSVSDLFAGRVETKERFDGVKFHLGTSGSPIIDRARAVIECSVWKVYDGGDHSLILGEVVGVSAMSNRRPLVYYAQQYTTTERAEQPAPPSDIIW
jgi:flavin reductase (DIM6/NTAB) family NADH-FMN oxidoreductase RutF